MRSEFKIDRQGKTFVLYAGLLAEAHEKGLEGIDTALVQIPNESNGDTAIVQAHVHLGGSTYSGIGDASPNNVSRNIALHLIRMAETRAKARALRDAVNVSETTLEELGDDNEGDTPGRQRPSPQATSSQGSGASEMPERTEGGATRKQLNYMLRLLPDHRKKQLEAEHGSVETWSKDAVRAMIEKLKPSDEASG